MSFIDTQLTKLILQAMPEDKNLIERAFILGHSAGNISGHELLMRELVKAANKTAEMYGATTVEPELFMTEEE